MIEARQPIATKHRHFRTARARRLFCETNLDAHLLIDADELKMLNTSGLTWGIPGPLAPARTRPGLAPIRFYETKWPLKAARPIAPKPTTNAAQKRSRGRLTTGRRISSCPTSKAEVSEEWQTNSNF